MSGIGGSGWNTRIGKLEESTKQNSGIRRTCLRNSRNGFRWPTTYEKFKKTVKYPIHCKTVLQQCNYLFLTLYKFEKSIWVFHSVCKFCYGAIQKIHVKIGGEGGRSGSEGSWHLTRDKFLALYSFDYYSHCVFQSF